MYSSPTFTFTFVGQEKGRYAISVFVVDTEGGTLIGKFSTDVFDVTTAPVVINGPSYAAAGFSSEYSVADIDSTPVASVWTSTTGGVVEATGSGGQFEFSPIHEGSYTISALLVDQDGTASAGARTIDVFGDIMNDVEAILWLAHQGITRGCGPYRFCPERLTTRGQMAAFLSRALDLPPTDEDHFSDDTGTVFEDDINRLAEAGIAHDCAPREFCHRQPLTRAELAGFMARALNLGVDAHDDYFGDDTGSPFEDDINRFVETDILDGCAMHRFCPDGTITRGQIAELFYDGRDLLGFARL